MKTQVTGEDRARSGRIRAKRWAAALPGRALVLLALFLCACESTRSDPGADKPEEHPDQEIITGELQSDFLELGEAAGVEWLSFYQDDFLEYPELFEGYDRDQRRHVRLAPRDGANKVLLKFDLPAGAKIKPVDWYGTECVAIDLPDAKGFTVSLSVRGKEDPTRLLAKERMLRLEAKGVTPKGETKLYTEDISDANQALVVDGTSLDRTPSEMRFVYGSRWFAATDFDAVLVVEAILPKYESLNDAHREGVKRIIRGAHIVRRLALEGSPKHQCTSSIEDLKAGIVAYEKGGLKLALPEGWALRKTGCSSTVEIDGAGAKPLALIRKLKPYSNGNLRGRVNADTVFARRRDRPDAFFSAGRALGDAEPFAVVFDYKDGGVEQVGLCVIATGNELLTVEIVSTGLREGEARRKAKESVLDLLSKAKPVATPAGSASALSDLVGWKPRE